MKDKIAEKDYNSMSPEEKKRDLFNRQKQTLDLFLERKAISKAEYEKSLNGLITKMGLELYEK